MALSPTRIEKLGDTEILLAWNDGSRFAVPFLELRYRCPCAFCVNEHTGERMIERERIRADIHAKAVNHVGMYGTQIRWSDGHSTGIYPHELLREISNGAGRPLPH